MGYEPDVNCEEVKLFFGFAGPTIDLINIGKYQLLVFPKSIQESSKGFFKTCFVPRKRAWMTFTFQVACFVILSWFASQFAGRPMTVGRLIPDFILVFVTVCAGLATAMTDPGMLPPNPPPEEDNEQSPPPPPAEVDPYNPLGSSQPGEEGELMKNIYLEEIDEDYRKIDPFRLSKCKYCKHFRPTGGAHCPRCCACVMGFDHHCSFLSHDIGMRNLRWFVLFIVLSLSCVLYSLWQFVKPFFYLIAFKDADLLENTPIRSNVALGVASAFLAAWSVLMAFMVANYIVMLFVPGSKSTRECWRKYFSKGGGGGDAANKNNNINNPPLPSWHPGHQQQLQEQQDALNKEKEPLRFWKIFFNIPPSLMPRWATDRVFEDDEQHEQQKDAEKTKLVSAAAASSSPSSGVAVSVVAEREELTAASS